MSRNPYQIDGEAPVVRRSIVAFLDVLGYKAMAVAARKANRENQLLATLYEALQRGREILDPDDPLFLDTEKAPYALVAFTDNIVIGWPVNDDAEIELGGMYWRLALFQLEMASRGFFVRGGLAVGNAYVDETAVFGDALLEAYEGESELARDPRIVLTSSTTNVMRGHLEYYGDSTHAPQNVADGSILNTL